MGGMITVFDPQGNAGEIPEANLAAFVKAGGMPAVHMTSPDGTSGYVPANRTQEAVKAGAKILPFEQQEVQHPGFWAHMLDDAWSMAKGVVEAGPTSASGDQISADAAYQEKLKAEGRSLPYRALMSLTPDVMRERAESGDVAGVASQGATMEAAAASPLATAATAPFSARMADAVSATPEAFARAVRASARGANTALQKYPGSVGMAAGGALGHATGIPGAGVLGGAAGAAVAKELLPKVRLPGEGFGFPSRVLGGPKTLADLNTPQPLAPSAPAAPVAADSVAQPVSAPKMEPIDPLLQRLRNIAANIQQEDAEEAARAVKEDDLTDILQKSVRRVKAAREVANPKQPIVPEGVDDLTGLLQESLKRAQAAKGALPTQ